MEQLTEAQIIELVEALAFYATPENYWGIGIFPDRPCGAFADDVSETPEFGWRPGKLARETLEKLNREVNGEQADCG